MTEPRFVTVEDYEPRARAPPARGVYDYYAGGAGDEWTVAENRRAFDRWMHRVPACCGGLDAPDLRTERSRARTWSIPVLIAPWASPQQGA